MNKDRCGECVKADFGGQPCCGKCTIDKHPITVLSFACGEFEQKLTKEIINGVMDVMQETNECAERLESTKKPRAKKVKIIE
jgi:hypothetical protein